MDWAGAGDFIDRVWHLGAGAMGIITGWIFLWAVGRSGWPWFAPKDDE